MKTKTCRVCRAPLYREPLISYRNMPKAAQFLPGKADLKREKGVDLDICQCSGCGLVQLPSAPVPYYREVLRAAAFSPEMKKFREAQFSRFVKEYGLRGKKVLELGCGKGEYLRLMKAAGADAYGLEYSAASVAECRKGGLKAERGYLDRKVKLRGGPFSAFYILNFLEHMPDPVAALSAMRDNLAPGGVGLVEVPDFDMMLSKNLFSEFIPDHLFYFTRRSLEFLLAASGLEVLKSGTVWHGYILSAEVRKRAPSDLKGFDGSRRELAAALKKFTARFGSGGTAVWGAGHQALAVLALAGLSGKVKYVVDSAPFKQGKYTPATHVPIVPPSALETAPPEAVIVMAASYSDEVLRLLRRNYPRIRGLAVLRERGLEVIA